MNPPPISQRLVQDTEIVQQPYTSDTAPALLAQVSRNVQNSVDRVSKKNYGVMKLKAKSSRKTKVEKLLGDSLQTHTLDLGQRARRSHDQENGKVVRRDGGQCLRCLISRQKVCIS